jgi:hypothetical protein
MIPLFPWFSMSLAGWLLSMIFPGLIPSVGSAVAIGGYWVGKTYHNTVKAVRRAILSGVLALTVWFGLLALAIYTRRWEFALVGLISTGVTSLLAAILLYTVKHVTNAVVSNLRSKISVMSGVIRLQTIPWDQQPLWMKLASLAASPVYGLYLLTMLPIKGVLETLIFVADFVVNDVLKWMNRIVVIVSAVSVCSFFLSGLVLFQLQFNMTGPLDMFTLGLSLLFIATLIALLLMTGSPLVKVLEFIQMLGFINLALIAFVGLYHFRPDLGDPIMRSIGFLWAGVVNNVSSHHWIAMLVAVGLSAIVCRLPWCRPFAGWPSLFILFLWVFSTDFYSKFYTRWDWWVTTVILLASWLYMKTWVLPSATTASGTQTAGANSPSHESNGHGHGHGGGYITFPRVVVAILIFLMWHSGFLGLFSKHTQAQVPPSTPPTASQPQTPVVPFVPANLEDFHILKEGSTDDVWEFQLDGREAWKTLPDITVNDGDEVELSASGQVCGASVGCVGPNGQQGPAKASTLRPGEFPFGDAWYQALVIRIGPHTFQAGDHKTFVVPDGTGYQSIKVIDNYRLPEITTASGGFRLRVVIRRKT